MVAQIQKINLVRGDLLRFDDDTDRLVECIEGTLWITLGDSHDVIVEQGETAFIDGGRLVLVSVLGGTARARLSEVSPEIAAAA